MGIRPPRHLLVGNRQQKNMKLTIVFLAVAVALAAGQNYYFHFSNAKSEPNRVAGGFYGPVEAHPLVEYSPVKESYEGYANVNSEPAPRIFFSNIFASLGITTQTIYKYSTTATIISTSFVVSSCVSTADANAAMSTCNPAAMVRGRRGIIEAISPSTIESVEATAVPSLEGVVRRQVRQLELASSLDEEEEQVLLDDGGSVKYPQKRQLNLNPFITVVTTSSVVTQFTVSTTTSSLAGLWTCTPAGFAVCAAAAPAT